MPLSVNRFRDVSVVCPFYKRSTHGSIGCWSPLKSSTLSISFGNPSDRVAFRKAACECDPSLCPLYQILSVWSPGGPSK